VRALAALSIMVLATACRDNSKFSTTHGDRYEGLVVTGDFVRAGIATNTNMCVSLDANHLQDAPGTLSTSDGRFKAAALRPIPQIWHDPLSTLQFGDDTRVENLVYAATPLIGDGGTAEAQDVFVVVSLVEERHIEIRLLRGAPQTDAGPPPVGVASTMFGVFHLERQQGPCSF
jgi:hypothetical protein